MTIEPHVPKASYTIAGTGPYAINWPYEAGAIRATVILGDMRTTLTADVDYTVSPGASTAGGNLTLAAGVATAHAGSMLRIVRRTVSEQGWQDISPREIGLAAQIDKMTMRLQELDDLIASAVKTDVDSAEFRAVADTVLAFDANRKPVSGPTVAAIAAAAANATAATAAAAQAVAAAAAAQAAQNSILKPKGQWLTATNYAVGDLVYQAGSQYECIAAHTSGTFATDLAPGGKWRIFVMQGAPGTGAGDVVAANNGSEFNPSQFRSNLALPLSPTTKLTGVDVLAISFERGGFWNIGAGCTNMPPGGADGDHMIAKRYDDNNVGLIWIFRSGALAVNKKDAGIWLGWVEQATLAYVDGTFALTRQFLHYQHTEGSGVAGGTFAAGAWVRRKLNRLRWNSITGASVASDQITLPAGTYDLHAWAAAFNVLENQLQIYDVTGAATLIAGSSEFAPPAPAGNSKSLARLRFTLTGTRVIELLHRCQQTRATDGLGRPASLGLTEVYAEVMIWKRA